MKIVAINALPFGSPAQIMNEILLVSKREIKDVEIFSFFPLWNRKKSKYNFCKSYGTRFESKLSFFLSVCTGYHNIFCKNTSKKLIKELEKIKPDIIHLHNLHIWPINIKDLFSYIKKNKVKVVWTLHDCWPFTGHCTYFSLIKCEKWKKECNNCPQLNKYPYSFMDRSKKMFLLKKHLFSSVNNLTIVTPSKWLADLVKQSYLKDYQIEVINNGIDLKIFKPIQLNVREKYGLSNKKMILGVSLEWGKRKGLDVFNSLADVLPDDYFIFLVGIDKKISRYVNHKIFTIERTFDQNELVGIYSTADVFFNPTREDNFPTVNIEALACGTPVITFNNGGSSEIIDSTCGVSLKTEDIKIIYENIKKICVEKPFSSEACIRRAQQFDKNKCFSKYVQLYKEEK